MFEAIRSGRLMPRGLLLTLFASALLLRVLVPAGWMPSTDGSFRIELCTGTGPAQASPEALKAMAALTDHQSSDKDGERSPSDQPCTFSGLGLAFSPPPEAPAAELAALAPPAVPYARPLSVSIGRGLAAPPPPSTGPPILS